LVFTADGKAAATCYWCKTPIGDLPVRLDGGIAVEPETFVLKAKS
jgi:hypothetical protein